MEEIWKSIEGYEGLYEVSSWGRVRSVDRWVVNRKNGSKRFVEGRIKKPSDNAKGYFFVFLYKDGKEKNYYIHRLVAQAFIENPDNLPQVNHKDENKSNNHVENLEWCDGKYNINYGSKVKKICQYTLDGELVKVWKSSIEVQRELGYHNGTIRACCNGRCKSAYGFLWTFHGMDLFYNRHSRKLFSQMNRYEKDLFIIFTKVFNRVNKGLWFDEDKMRAYILNKFTNKGGFTEENLNSRIDFYIRNFKLMRDKAFESQSSV